MKDRHIEIDRLRGVAMLGMILIHANAYFLADKTAHILWDTNQYAVPAFIFCSFYIFFHRKTEFSWSYLKKRFLRLMIPYWIFLLFFIPLEILKEPHKTRLINIFQYITLTTPGNDLSWLVLLFLMLTLIGLFINYLGKNNRFMFLFYVLLSLCSSILIVFYQPPINQKLVMWLPWSLVIIFTWYFVKHEDKKGFLLWSALISGLVFLGVRLVEMKINHPLSHYDNKYPPNLYHLSYGIFWITALFYLAKKNIFEFFPLRNLLHFLSINSYSIFFVHFLLITYFGLYQWQNFARWGWFGYFTIILFLTLAIKSAILKLKH